MRLTMAIPKVRTWHLLGLVATVAAYIAVFQFRWDVQDHGYAAIRRLRSLDATGRIQAANALRSMRPIERRAIAPLMEMLFDGDPGARVAAAEALLYLTIDDRSRPADEAIVGPVKAALASALGDSDPVARLAIADTLSKLGTEPKVIVPTLLQFAADRDGRNRAKAISDLGLSLRGSEPALAAVLAALGDADPQVREAAVSSLGYGATVPRAASEPLMERIKVALLGMSGDSNQPVRLGAIGAMNRIAQVTRADDPRVLRFLDDPDNQIRYAVFTYVCWSRAEKRFPEFVTALERSLKDPDWIIRQSSAVSLGQIGLIAEPALPTLRAMLDRPGKDEARAAIIDSIADIENACRKFREETLPMTIAELADADPTSRGLAAGRLGEFGRIASKAVPDLVRCLDDREPDVRRASASALGKLGPDAAVAIPKLAELAKADDREEVRQASKISRATLLREAESPRRALPE